MLLHHNTYHIMNIRQLGDSKTLSIAPPSDERLGNYVIQYNIDSPLKSLRKFLEESF